MTPQSSGLYAVDDVEAMAQRLEQYAPGLNAAAMLRSQAERIAALRKVTVNVTAHLVAAHSPLKRGGKKAAGSDKMFEIMLKDYEASIDTARAALKEGKP